MDGYDRFIRYWDEVYAAEEPAIPLTPDTGIPALTAGMAWLCDGAQSILDFGCGNGTSLCWCALRGVRSLTGVDLSTEAVRLARTRGERMPSGHFDIRQGGVDALDTMPDASFDGVILMNILDNLWPQDAERLLTACARLLRPGGKVLITLNPRLPPEQIEAWHIRVIEGDLLDDGLLLNNLSDSAWQSVVTRFLPCQPPEPLFMPGQEQPSRLMRARKGGHAIPTDPTGGTP